MADDKPTEKQETPSGDGETAALAQAIAGGDLTPTPVIDESGLASAPKPDASKEEKVEEKPDTSGEKKEEVEGEKPYGEKPKEGEQEDPLKGFELKALLEHPTVGPILSRWKDRAATAEVQQALEKERPTIEHDAQAKAAEAAEDKHFSGMSQEAISEEISESEEAATAYARFQQRKQAGAGLDPEAVTKASQVYSYAARVAAVTGVIEGSELSDEVKATLKPDNFTYLGPAGIVEWEKAVFTAMVTHEASQLTEKELEAKFETYKQEHLAETDGERPPVGPGRRAAATADLMETPSDVILESGLAKAEQDRAKK